MSGDPIEGYRLTPAAEGDLAGIWDHTAETWGPDQADSYVRGLARTFDVLAEFPEIARERTEIDPPVRCHSYRSHLIIYRIENTCLLIVRVVHTRRHWTALLEHQANLLHFAAPCDRDAPRNSNFAFDEVSRGHTRIGQVLAVFDRLYQFEDARGRHAAKVFEGRNRANGAYAVKVARINSFQASPSEIDGQKVRRAQSRNRKRVVHLCTGAGRSAGVAGRDGGRATST